MEDIPDRFRFTSERRDGANAVPLGSRFTESMNPMLGRTFPGRDRGPEHRTEGGRNRCQIAGSPARHQSGEVRHFPSGHEWPGNFPVSGIPADNQHATLGHRYTAFACRSFFHFRTPAAPRTNAPIAPKASEDGSGTAAVPVSPAAMTWLGVVS